MAGSVFADMFAGHFIDSGKCVQCGCNLAAVNVAGAAALAADLLTGRINPSGKLAESFPLKLEDNPSFLNFPGKRYEVSYSEGVFLCSTTTTFFWTSQMASIK